MVERSLAQPTSLFAVLHDAVESLQRATGADMATAYLYDEDTRRYYAPAVVGLPEDGLLGSISDLAEQLARYDADAAQGKAPDELQLAHYGPSVYVTVTRRALVADDAPNQIQSSFIRRHQIQSVVGLPLVVGDTLVGLIYLDFLSRPALDTDRLAQLERAAAAAAAAVDRARRREESAATAAVSRLAARLATPPVEGADLAPEIAAALALVLETSGCEAAVAYRLDGDRRLGLLGHRGAPDAPPSVELADAPARANGHGGVPDAAVPQPAPTSSLADAEAALARVLADPDRRVVATIPMADSGGQLNGYLALLSRDPLALLRRAPATELLLRTAAALVSGAVRTQALFATLARTNQVLEVTTDVSKAIASSIDLDQTLRLVARNLIRVVDASLCQIALYEEDGTAWFGAAASAEEELWRRQRGERPGRSFLFDVLDRRAPLAIEDVHASDFVPAHYARLFGIRSLMAIPLLADEQPIGVAVLAQRDQRRAFTPEEIQRASGLAAQAAVAIKNARAFAYTEEELHIQKDLVLVGFGQWGQKAYQHLLTLKQFLNFKTHVVETDSPARREQLAAREQDVLAHGDAFYWDSPQSPAFDQLRRALESSCYVITYIATPAATHLPMLAQFYDLSNVVLIEKPLGAPPEAYRAFLDSVDGSVEIVAADHYYFKLEVRLLQVLLAEERTLRAFLDTVEEIEVELLEEQPLSPTSAAIGIIADMVPHAFAVLSLFTPIDRIHPDSEGTTLLIGRQEPLQGDRETYARLNASFRHQGRTIRLVVDVGKGIENSKWIKLNGERRPGGRRSFYKFDFVKGEAIDGTQTNLRAAIRRIREPGVPDSAHLTMMRHVLEKRHPAVGILAIREAMRSNQRILELQALASDLLERGEWTPYTQGQRPDFPTRKPLVLHVAPAEPTPAVAVEAAG